MFLWSEVSKENNTVLRILSAKTGDTPNWAVDTEESFWVLSDYSTAYNGIESNIGATYFPELDVFARPQPYASWTFDSEAFDWVPPIAHPDPDPFVAHLYEWNEEAGQWDFYGDKSNTKDGY